MESICEGFLFVQNARIVHSARSASDGESYPEILPSSKSLRNFSPFAALRARSADCRGEVGISAWNGLALVRLVAQDGMSLRHDLVAVLAALDVPLPRLWLN